MKSILIIDDKKANLTALEGLLESSFPEINILKSLSGKEGIQIAKEEQVEIILLDVVMPEMDGYETCIKLKKDKRTDHIPIILITAVNVDTQSRIKGLNSGADAFISKPIDQDEFKAQINAILRIKEALNESSSNLNKAQKKLLRNQYFLSKAQEIGKVGTWELNLLNNELKWTDQNYLNFGIPFGTPLTYKMFLESVHPEDRDYVNAEWSAAMQGTPYDIEHRLLINDEIRWLREKANVEFDKKGKAIRAIGFTQDITIQKKAEEELVKAKNNAEKNELQLNAIIENSPTGFAINKISSGKVSYVNQAFADAYHIPIELCTEVSAFFEYVYGDQKDLGNKVLNDVKSGIPERMKWEKIPIKDKTSKRIHYVSASNIVLEKLDLMISTVIDITSQIESQNNLQLSKEKAEESDRLKSAFLANMSHEIRTPMNGILGFTDLLKEADLTGQEREKYINVIEKSGLRMLNTINDIIDISRVESGEVGINNKPTNINSRLESLYDFFRPEAEKKNIKLSFVPGLDKGSAEILTDPEKMDAICTNLIKNALKFTREGSIEFGYKVKEEELHFYTKDTGEGINSDKLETIFNRFTQEEEVHTRSQQGSGLGLSIVKAYVELMKGKVWVESVKGEGSTFHFTMPYKPIKKGISKDETDDKHITNQKIKLENQTILIAEDDEASYEYLKVIFKSNGVRNIIPARNGEESIKLCKENSAIDLVLMDINMPVMNGYEATKAIKVFRPDLPIIAQTAYALVGDREKSLGAGCDDYITKPVKKEELLEKLEKFLK